MSVDESTALDPAEALAELANLKAEISKIPKHECFKLGLPPIMAARRGVQLHQVALRDRALFAETFVKPPLDEIDTLRARSLALWAAQVELDRIDEIDQDQRGELPALAAMALRQRKEFMNAARFIWLGDTQVQAVLEGLRRGRGSTGRADDLTTLAALFRARFDDVKARTAITRDQIDELARLGSRLLLLIDPPEEGTATNDARWLRNQAYTYFVRAYGEIRDAARYLFRQDPQRRGDYLPLRRGTLDAPSPPRSQDPPQDPPPGNNTQV